MKVTQVLYSGLGGHGSVAFSLIEAGKNSDISFSMVFSGIEPLKDEYREKCITLKLPFSAVNTSQHSTPVNWLMALKAILFQKPDVVVLHSATLAFIVPVLRIFGIKVIAVDHTPNSTKRRNEWISIRALFYFANQLVFLTSTHAEELKNIFGRRFPLKKSNIIGNGMDIQRYHPTQKSSPPPFQFAMQARFSTTKDFQTLIKAAALLKQMTDTPFIVRLAGDGDTRKKCEDLTHQLEIADIVQFEGMLPEQALIQLLSEIHVYIHSTHSEAMSTSVMQALSCGLPVLASDIAGMGNLIKNKENGILFKESDEHQLAKLMLLCINGEIDLGKLASNARNFAEKELSMDIMFNRYYQLITK